MRKIFAFLLMAMVGYMEAHFFFITLQKTKAV